MVNAEEKPQQSAMETAFDQSLILGIQRVIAQLNHTIKFKIQLTHDIEWMLILDAMERIDPDDKKIKSICDYLRLKENLETFNFIQKGMHGAELLMLLGESSGEKLDFKDIIKELLTKTKSENSSEKKDVVKRIAKKN